MGRDGYRIRVGTYRIIYDIFDTTLVIEIVNVGSRGNIYED
jgi:mRNA interferase RelE/StbE